jgi:hypothetical protein
MAPTVKRQPDAQAVGDALDVQQVGVGDVVGGRGPAEGPGADRHPRLQPGGAAFKLPARKDTLAEQILSESEIHRILSLTATH